MDLSESSGSSGSELSGSESSDEFTESSESDEEESDPESSGDEVSNLSQQLSQISNRDEEICSEDDRSGAFHWSRQHEETVVVATDPLMQAGEFGKPAGFPDSTTPGQLVSYIMDDEWLSNCVQATFAYGQTNPEFLAKLPCMSNLEKGKAFAKHNMQNNVKEAIRADAPIF